MTETEVPMPWVKSMPEGRAVTMEYENITPFEFLKRRATNQPNQLAMILPKGVEMTFGEAFMYIKKVASKMQAMGIKKGDKVALMYNNVPHYLLTHYAVLGVGATVVQANPLYTYHELKHLIEDSGAKALFTLTMFQETANRVLDDTNLEFVVYGRIQEYLKTIVKIFGKLLRKSIFNPKGDRFDAPRIDHPNTYDWSDFIAGEGEFKEVEVDFENDIAILQYTGGTTGFPKGAMLSHKNISVNAQQARAVIHMVPDNTGSILTVLPMFHVFGLTACINLAIQVGVPMVLNIASPPDFGEILEWIEKYKITFFPGVPRMFIAINSHPNAASTDFSSLIACISGAAPLPLEVAHEFHRVTGAHLVEGFGMSETSPLTHINPIGGSPREGSIGLPAPDTLCKIVDIEDYTKTLPIGEVGEICIKGPQVFHGYWNNKGETDNMLMGDGWTRTGDIGKMDEDGYAYIVDRKKDMVIVSGYNVYPREVEEVLFKHPAVQEAAVAGINDKKRGEIVGAWIVLKDGMTATEKEILDHCKEHMAAYKVPKQVIFRDELPTTMVGKVLRRKLQETDEPTQE